MFKYVIINILSIEVSRASPVGAIENTNVCRSNYNNSNMQNMFSVTLTDDVCGVSYIDISTHHYLVWDGSHIGQDTLVNIVDYSVIEKKDSGSCKVGFEPLYTSFDVCVTVKEFHIEDCNATVNYYHSGDSEIKAVSVLFSVQILFICSRLLAALNDVTYGYDPTLAQCTFN